MRHDDPNTTPPKHLGAQGQEDTFKGKAKQWWGKIQQKAGGLTGNRSQQAKGTARQAGGTMQSGSGKVERTVDDVLDTDKR